MSEKGSGVKVNFEAEGCRDELGYMYNETPAATTLCKFYGRQKEAGEEVILSARQ
jgi:hypothetical protein